MATDICHRSIKEKQQRLHSDACCGTLSAAKKRSSLSDSMKIVMMLGKRRGQQQYKQLQYNQQHDMSETEFSTTSYDERIRMTKITEHFNPQYFAENAKAEITERNCSLQRMPGTRKLSIILDDLDDEDGDDNHELNRSEKNEMTPLHSYVSAKVPVLVEEQGVAENQLNNNMYGDKRNLMLQRSQGLRKLPSPKHENRRICISAGGKFNCFGSKKSGTSAVKTTTFISSPINSAETLPSTCSFNDLVKRSKTILRDVGKELQEQVEEQEMIEQSIYVHTERAKARYLSGNIKGALISLHRQKKLQEFVENTTRKVIGYLQSLQVDVQDVYNRAKKLHWEFMHDDLTEAEEDRVRDEGIQTAFGRGQSHRNSFHYWSTQHLSLSVDLAQFTDFRETVERMMIEELQKQEDQESSFYEQKTKEQLYEEEQQCLAELEFMTSATRRSSNQPETTHEVRLIQI